jgi:hypothetical protein
MTWMSTIRWGLNACADAAHNPISWRLAHLFAELVTNVELLGDSLLRFAVCAATLQHAFDPLALVFVFQGYALQSTRPLGLAGFLISRIFVNVRELVD